MVTKASSPNPHSAAAPEGRRTRSYPGLLAAALVCLLAMLAYFLWASHRHALQAAEITTENLSLAVESRVHADLERATAVLDLMAREVRPEQLQQAAVAAHNSALSTRMLSLLEKSPQVAVANLFDAQGKLLYSSNPAIRQFSIADRAFFKPLRDDPEAGHIFSEAQISRSTGHWAMVIVRALRNAAGNFNGIAAVVINLEQYTGLFGGIDVGPGGVTLLRRSDDFKLVLRYPAGDATFFNQSLPATNPIRQSIEAGERSGTLTLKASTDGIQRIASFRKLDGYPFYVQVALAETDYLAAWRQQAAITGGLVALVVLIFSIVVARLIKADHRVSAVARRLAYREAVFSALFEQSSFLAGILDSTGHLLEVNNQALKVIGARRENVLGRYFPDTPWWSRPEHKAALEQLLRSAAEGHSGSIEAVHPDVDGKLLTIQFHAIPVRAWAASLIAVTGVDISALKQAQQLLEDSRERMELALSGGDLGMWDWQVSSGKVIFNERWCSMLGYRLDEIKPHLDSWSERLHPDDQAAINAALQPHLKGQTPTYECEHRLLHKDGHWVWILDRGRVVQRDPAGAPLRVVGTHMDIGARKQAEAELLRSNSELEQFSYTISHDMRQPLRMITSYLQLLEVDLADQLDAVQRDYFNFAIDGAKRLDQMLVGLLEYSRVGRHGEPPTWVDSRALLDEALRYLQPAIAEAQAEIRIEGEWPRILVSPDEMLRLLQNLIGNALKYRVAGRRPEITLSSEVAYGRWRLRVADNGVGILPDQAGRLFQVFQRLHSRTDYEGSGIGLALCRKIVEHHGGQIRAESAGAGQGSCFCVELPRAEEGAA